MRLQKEIRADFGLNPENSGRKRMETLIIHGCGGHARSVAAAVKKKWQIIFVDANAAPDEKIMGFPVLPRVEDIPGHERMARHVATGNLVRKKELFLTLREKGVPLPVLLSESAEVSEYARLGDGVFIGAGAYVGPGAEIGDNAIVNTHAVVEHDAKIGAHTHISIHATVAGYSVVGESAMLGAGATVIDGIRVGDEVVVGAGAVVVHPLESSGTYLGVPARKKMPPEAVPETAKTGGRTIHHG